MDMQKMIKNLKPLKEIKKNDLTLEEKNRVLESKIFNLVTLNN